MLKWPHRPSSIVRWVRVCDRRVPRGTVLLFCLLHFIISSGADFAFFSFSFSAIACSPFSQLPTADRIGDPMTRVPSYLNMISKSQTTTTVSTSMSVARIIYKDITYCIVDIGCWRLSEINIDISGIYKFPGDINVYLVDPLCQRCRPQTTTARFGEWATLHIPFKSIFFIYFFLKLCYKSRCLVSCCCGCAFFHFAFENKFRENVPGPRVIDDISMSAEPFDFVVKILDVADAHFVVSVNGSFQLEPPAVCCLCAHKLKKKIIPFSRDIYCNMAVVEILT